MNESMEKQEGQQVNEEKIEGAERRIEQAREVAQEWYVDQFTSTVDRYHEEQMKDPTFEMNSREYNVEDVEGMSVCIAKAERNAVEQVLTDLRTD